MNNVCLCPWEQLLWPGWSGPEETVGSAHYGAEQGRLFPEVVSSIKCCDTHTQKKKNNVEKNSLRDECLARLLSLTDVLIAFDYVILDTQILRLLWELNGSTFPRVSHSLMTYSGAAFHEFFSSHCFLNSLWLTIFLCLASVQLLGHCLPVM